MEKKNIREVVDTPRGRNSSTPLFGILSHYQSTKEAMNAMNCHLQSIFVVSDWDNIDDRITELHEDDCDWKIDVSSPAICKALRQLSKKKSSPDIPNRLYESDASQLSAPLSKLLKLSFDLGQVPETWKKAVISPIPKTRTGNSTVEDIRPTRFISYCGQSNGKNFPHIH